MLSRRSFLQFISFAATILGCKPKEDNTLALRNAQKIADRVDERVVVSYISKAEAEVDKHYKKNVPGAKYRFHGIAVREVDPVDGTCLTATLDSQNMSLKIGDTFREHLSHSMKLEDFEVVMIEHLRTGECDTGPDHNESCPLYTYYGVEINGPGSLKVDTTKHFCLGEAITYTPYTVNLATEKVHPRYEIVRIDKDGEMVAERLPSYSDKKFAEGGVVSPEVVRSILINNGAIG